MLYNKSTAEVTFIDICQVLIIRLLQRDGFYRQICCFRMLNCPNAVRIKTQNAGEFAYVCVLQARHVKVPVGVYKICSRCQSYVLIAGSNNIVNSPTYNVTL